jgi:PPOX class probable F420-dependent enzyme
LFDGGVALCDDLAMPTLETFRSLLASETGLATVTTLRSDGRPFSSVVNAGVLDHPVSGRSVVAFVARGDAARLGHLRRDPRINILVRRGWQWSAVEGVAALFGPDDPDPLLDADGEGYRRLSREIFRVAGGEHDDWEEYDRVMLDERRCCVLVEIGRAYSNPSAG